MPLVPRFLIIIHKVYVYALHILLHENLEFHLTLFHLFDPLVLHHSVLLYLVIVLLYLFLCLFQLSLQPLHLLSLLLYYFPFLLRLLCVAYLYLLH